MAAVDLQPDWISVLPKTWSYGVTRDGRVFFVNEEAQSTTWLHPVSGEALITGHRKTPDLPTGWEEGYTFEGARCFINHNERKVSCNHPVSGCPSQDNCIFVLSEQSKGPVNEKNCRPLGTMSETCKQPSSTEHPAPCSTQHPHPALCNTQHPHPVPCQPCHPAQCQPSPCPAQPSSPTTRPSRNSKKIHNFGKRSNSIRRNPGAPVIRSNWLYKQDSTGMKLWKKRWFVLSDMCLFYYRDEKEEGILGSILLPSFHISMLSVDDHVNRKYAFKATHPNMRTYYFCCDTAKDMEAWMKAMTDAALVHSEPVKRLDRLTVDQCGPQDVNHVSNHHHHHHYHHQQVAASHPEMHNNNGDEIDRHNGESERQEEPPTPTTPDPAPTSIIPAPSSASPAPTAEEEKRQQEAERYGFHRDDQSPLTKINSVKLQPTASGQVDGPHGARPTPSGSPRTPAAEADAPHCYYRAPGEVNGGGDHSPTPAAATEEGGGAPSMRSAAAPCRHDNEGGGRSLSRTSSMQQLQQWVRTQQRVRCPDDDTRSVSSYQTLPRNMPSSHRGALYSDTAYRSMPRGSMAQRDSICSMSPSLYDHAMLGPASPYSHAPGGPAPQYDHALLGPASQYDQGQWPTQHRPVRDATLWQLYEWKQRQAYCRGPPGGGGGGGGLYANNMPGPKTMVDLSDRVSHGPSIPPSPSHGSLSMYGGGGGGGYLSPMRSYNMSSARSEGPSPVYRGVGAGDASVDRRHRTHATKYAYPGERRASPAGLPVQNLSAQSLQGKTSEELTLLLIALRRQQAELNSVRANTVAQLMQLDLDAGNAKDFLSPQPHRNLHYLDNQFSPEDYREPAYMCRPEEVDIDAKLSRLCEQDKTVRLQENKLQQLHREKHTLETALLSASQEIEVIGCESDASALNSIVQQRDDLQNGLLGTCRELSRVSAELERSWRDYDRLEGDVNMAKSNLLEQLEALGSPQTEPPSRQHVHIQKELWRIQDVMEVLSKHKAQRSQGDSGGLYASTHQEEEPVPPRPPLPRSYHLDSPTLPPPSRSSSSLQRPAHHRSNGSHTGPDYRLYKSEPELTTVAEVDEGTNEERSEQTPAHKGMSYPVGIVPPRTKSPMAESSSIASYVTLRKNRKTGGADRPRSAADQCAGESGRGRMSVEEQLERIRRHQQGALRDKKKNPALNPALVRDKANRSAQSHARRREESLVSDIEQLEASMREQDMMGGQETPAEEIARLREASMMDSLILEQLGVSEETSIPEQEADKQKKVDRIKALIAKNSMQNVVPSLSPDQDEQQDGSGSVHQEKLINISYDLAAQASRRSKLTTVKTYT